MVEAEKVPRQIAMGLKTISVKAIWMYECCISTGDIRRCGNMKLASVIAGIYMISTQSKI